MSVSQLPASFARVPKPFRHLWNRVRRLPKRRRVWLCVAVGFLTLWCSLILLLPNHEQNLNAHNLLRALKRENAVSLEPSEADGGVVEVEEAVAVQEDPVSPVTKKPRPAAVLRSKAQQNRIDQAQLKWSYLADEKLVEYVPHPDWVGLLPQGSRLYTNALATFPQGDSHRRMHGRLGLSANGTALWQPKPKPPPATSFEGGVSAALKHGGFFLALSDALPVDREVPDFRESVCAAQKFDVASLPDASIVITFFNEPLSTLLRTVYSVLNYSPAPLIREVLLVDDHSDINEETALLQEHVKGLPKVKLMRLAERKGIVQARLAGARTAKGKVFIVLDSHIEVAPGWLEPQLARIRDSPRSVVFPQILTMHHETFDYKPEAGIGCFLDFRWAIVEHAKLTGKVKDPAALASPSMAGGLFAIDLDWFWELGGYDDEFVAWGAENVEMALRVWMCGGRVECAPCSRTYHVFRKGGMGYSNPTGALWRNRRRTARVWMDEYDQLAAPIIDRSAVHSPDEDFGPVSKMLALKRKLQCKSFRWFMDNIVPTHDVQDLSDVIGLGRLRQGSQCVDLNGFKTVGKPLMAFTCHLSQNYTGNQGFLVSKHDDNRIRLMSNDKRCVAWVEDRLQIEQCTNVESRVWDFVVEDSREHTFRIEYVNGRRKKDHRRCLAITERKFHLLPCSNSTDLIWNLDRFEYEAHYVPADLEGR